TAAVPSAPTAIPCGKGCIEAQAVGVPHPIAAPTTLSVAIASKTTTLADVSGLSGNEEGKHDRLDPAGKQPAGSPGRHRGDHHHRNGLRDQCDPVGRPSR